jgi:hypothetical protein
MSNMSQNVASENAGKMQMNGKFQKGQSGNPKGKTKGTKNELRLPQKSFWKASWIMLLES